MLVYEGMLAETVRYTGHGGDTIDAYLARPLGLSSSPGVVVLHHMPGWDEATKEITRKLAFHGYTAISPHLFTREGPGSTDDLSAAVRAAGGVPDERCVGDVDGAVKYLKALPFANGKVGVIGFCSGGRQAYMVACKVAGLDAAVDCWGGRVIASPHELTPRQPVAPIDMTPDLACPLLGIFGAEDRSPTPEQVAETEKVLQKHGKVYEFHMYEGAGHGFFAVNRKAYRPLAAVGAWQKIFAWYEKYLSPSQQ
jgi:carboxymethylenebutenolidase